MPTYKLGAGRFVSFGPADQLGKPGGEGTVYGVPSEPDIAIKIYHQTNRSPVQAQKLRAMISAPPIDPTIASGHRSICWPLDIVLEGSVVVGFTMPRFSKGMVEFSEFYYPASRSLRWPHMTFQHIVAAGGNIASVFEALHAKGYVVGDVNCNNWMIGNDCRASVIDTDSFQVPDPTGKSHLCRVAMPGYMAPELAVNSSRSLTVLRTAHQDDFSLAVMLFQLLVQGQHPTRGLLPDTFGSEEQSKINFGAFPWAGRLPGQSPLPSVRHLYDSLDARIRALFERCFIDGFKQPSVRPTPKEWKKVLHEAYDTGLINCSKNSQHWYFAGSAQCVWCQHRDRTGIDLFPSLGPRSGSQNPGGQISVPPGATSAAAILPTVSAAVPTAKQPAKGATTGWSPKAKWGLATVIIVPALLLWFNRVQAPSTPSPEGVAPSQSSATGGATTAYIDGRFPYVNLRQAPSETSAVVTQVPAGSSVSVMDNAMSVNQPWAKASWNGQSGYVIRTRLQSSPVAVQPQAALAASAGGQVAPSQGDATLTPTPPANQAVAVQKAVEEQRRSTNADAASSAEIARKAADDAAARARADQLERERVLAARQEDASRKAAQAAAAQVEYQNAVAIAEQEYRQTMSTVESAYRQKQSEVQRIYQQESAATQSQLQQAQSVAQGALQIAQKSTKNQIALSLAQTMYQQSIANAQSTYQAAHAETQARYQQALSDVQSARSTAILQAQEARKQRIADAQAARQMAAK